MIHGPYNVMLSIITLLFTDISSTLKVEVLGFCETFVAAYQTTSVSLYKAIMLVFVTMSTSDVTVFSFVI